MTIRGQQVRQVYRFSDSIAPQTISISAIHAQSAQLNAHEVLISSSTDCFFLEGSNPTATIANGVRLPANTSWVIQVNPGNKLSIITSSATGTFHIAALA